jgi:hypothetical protein
VILRISGLVYAINSRSTVNLVLVHGFLLPKRGKRKLVVGPAGTNLVSDPTKMQYYNT